VGGDGERKRKATKGTLNGYLRKEWKRTEVNNKKGGECKKKEDFLKGKQDKIPHNCI